MSIYMKTLRCGHFLHSCLHSDCSDRVDIFRLTGSAKLSSDDLMNPSDGSAALRSFPPHVTLRFGIYTDDRRALIIL